jgi:hypothetical protein
MAAVKEAGERRRGTVSLQERSPGHWRLRAYNPATGRQVTRRSTAPREEPGAGVREARKALAQLVAELEVGEGPAHGAMGPTLGGLSDELAQPPRGHRSLTDDAGWL